MALPRSGFAGRRRLSRPLSPACPSSPYAPRIVASADFVAELAEACIGTTFNQYAAGSHAPIRRERLTRYLEGAAGADLLLVGEAPGYRGARISGIPFTSERQLTGSGPAEVTATVVHRVLGELELVERVLLWNLVPTHPGTPSTNRRPTRGEVEVGLSFVRKLARGRTVVPVGRLAHAALGSQYVRHPAHGGARDFRSGLIELLDRGTVLSRTA